MKRWVMILVATLGASVTACDDTDCRNDLTWSTSFDGELVSIDSTAYAGIYGLRGTEQDEYVETIRDLPWLKDVPEEERRIKRGLTRNSKVGMYMRDGIISVRVTTRTTVEMRRPSAAGSYPLADLAARVCERYPDEVCIDVTGLLEVHEVVAPCGTDGCGKLEATLTIDEPEPMPHEAIVYGKGTLHYRETVNEVCIGPFALLETPQIARGVA